MELVKVVLEYQDRFSTAGEAKIEEARRWGVKPVGLPRTRTEAMVAVFGDYGVSALKRAGEVAILGVIGRGSVGDTSEEWEVVVVSAEIVGTVHVERPDPPKEA